MSTTDLPFLPLAQQLLEDLAGGNCVAITGLSNTGKSTLMRGLASHEAAEAYKRISGEAAHMIYVDCNRAVAISAQAFYEIVLRSALEQLAEVLSTEIVANLRNHHQMITESESAFSASLSFNLALTELCEQLKRKLCLLIDEFDEIYASLDDRALLNLRALWDRFSSELAYGTATLRALPRIRGKSFADEFAELFSHHTYPMPALDESESQQVLQAMEGPSLTPERATQIHNLAGGHPGLLIAAAMALLNIAPDQKGDEKQIVSQNPQARAECLKIWSQLTLEERESLTTLVLDPQAGIASQQRLYLETQGLLSDGMPFSPIFTDFLRRKAQGPEVRPQGVYLDMDSGDVWVDGIRIPVLTDLEFRLLALLYERRDKLTDKYRIVTAVWGEDYLGEIDDARVEKLVSRLRSKIEPDPANPRYLLTQRGRGYKLLSVPRSQKT